MMMMEQGDPLRSPFIFSSELQQRNLCIIAKEDIGELPANVPVELPRETSLALIRQRLATPVGSFKVEPVVVFDEDELEYLRLDAEPKWLQTA